MWYLVCLKSFAINTFAGLIYIQIVLGGKQTCTAKFPLGFCLRQDAGKRIWTKSDSAPPTHYKVQKPDYVVMDSGVTTYDCANNKMGGLVRTDILPYCCTSDMLQGFSTGSDYNKLKPSDEGGVFKEKFLKICAI